jgi:hypothetical protein
VVLPVLYAVFGAGSRRRGAESEADVDERERIRQ